MIFYPNSGRIMTLLMAGILLASCSQDDSGHKLRDIDFFSATANLGSHKLAYVKNREGEQVVIFENGLGDFGHVWNDTKLIVAQNHVTVTYNRGGYGTSELGPVPRDIARLASELHSLKKIVSPNQKVILVGHSIGGTVIRTYAHLYPETLLGLVFVDSSHEDDLVLTQADEDEIAEIYEGNPGANAESVSLIESMEYLKTLGTLPDVPTVAITSIKGKSASAARAWENMHKSLGASLTNFTQISTSKSGHHIQRDEPELVAEVILDMIEGLDR